MDEWSFALRDWESPGLELTLLMIMENEMYDELAPQQALFICWRNSLLQSTQQKDTDVFPWLGNIGDSIKQAVFQTKQGEAQLANGIRYATVISTGADIIRFARGMPNLGQVRNPFMKGSDIEPDAIPRVADMITDVIKREGGFVDHPVDRGGPTNFGITLKTYQHVYPKATVGDLKAMTESKAYAIYFQIFVDETNVTDMAAELPETATYLLDAIVHHGPQKAITMWQKLVGATEDGIIGPNTISRTKFMVDTIGVGELISRYLEARLAYMYRIVENDPTQAVFLPGWRNRVAILERLNRTRNFNKDGRSRRFV